MQVQFQRQQKQKFKSELKHHLIFEKITNFCTLKMVNISKLKQFTNFTNLMTYRCDSLLFKNF